MKKIIAILSVLISLNVIAQCPTPITFSLNPTPATCSTCCDGSLTVNNIQNGCPAYNVQLSPFATSSSFGSFSNLCAGTNYTVTVYDNGCCGSSGMVCSMNYSTATTCTTPISYSITTTPETCPGCCDGSASVINLTGGCGSPYSFTWTPAATTSQTITGLCSGNYSVTVQDIMGGSCCPNVTQGCFVPPGTATGIAQHNLTNEAIIVTPTENGNFKMLLPKNLPFPDRITVRNITGKEITVVYPARAYEFDFDFFEKKPAGVYIISVSYSDKIITKKIVKN